MSIYIPAQGNSGGVTVDYLQSNYASKSLINSRLASKLSTSGGTITGPLVMSGSVDIGGSTSRVNSMYINALDCSSAVIPVLTTNTVINPNTANKIVINGSDLGLTLDGITDDATALQSGLQAYSDIGQGVTCIINSQYGMALYSVVSVKSNVHLIINCPIFYYGDAGIRTYGDIIYGSNLKMDTGTSVNEGDTVMTLLNVAALSELSVGGVVRIRGASDANGNILNYETNVVTAITGNVITFKNPFEYDYKDVFQTYANGYVDRSYVVPAVSAFANSVNPTRGSNTLTVNSVASLQIGQFILLNDYALVQTDWPSNTSNNTYRNDVNRITDISGLVVTVEKPLVMDYNVTTYPLYIMPCYEARGTTFENFRIVYKKNPTNRNRHALALNMSQNCRINNCSVVNRLRNTNIIVNNTTGSYFAVAEKTGGGYLDLAYCVIPNGLYKIADLCTLIKTGLTNSSIIGINQWSYNCTYSEATGKITISTVNPSNQFRIKYDPSGLVVSGTTYKYLTTLIGFLPDDTLYYDANSFTGECVHLSGSWLLPATNNKFYFQEATGGEKTITFDTSTFYNISTLIKDLARKMTAASATGLVYSITFDEKSDCLTFTNTTAAVFSINLSGKTDTIYQYIGLHNAKGAIISTQSGQSSYSTSTTSSVPIRLTCTSKGNGFRIDTSIDCIVNGCTFGNSTHVSSGESYGFSFYRCRSCIISNCISNQARHACLFQTAHCNILTNFIDSNSRISGVDFHGLNSIDNLISGVISSGGVGVSPDATSHSAIKVGNTSHVAGDHYNTIKNYKITGYSNTNTSITNSAIYLLPNSSNNIIEGVDCDGCDIGIQITDVTSKDSAVFNVNKNIIRNCTFKNAKQPFYINIHDNATTLTTLTDLLIDKCIWTDIGTGSSNESRAIIKYGTNVTLKDCTFKDIVTGSSDLEAVYGLSNTNFKVLDTNFINMKRGIYMDTNNTYTVNNCVFDSLSGATHVVIKDANTGNTGVWSGNTYLNCTPRTSYTNSGTGSNITWRSKTNRQKLYISNAASATTCTATVAMSNTALTTGGVTVMGTTVVTYTSVEIYGQLYIEGNITYQLPASISGRGQVIAMLFYSSNAGSTYTCIGHSVDVFETAQINIYKTIRVHARQSFTDKLSSSTASFDLRIATSTGDALTICNTFAQKPYFTVTETYII